MINEFELTIGPKKLVVRVDGHNLIRVDDSWWVGVSVAIIIVLAVKPWRWFL